MASFATRSFNLSAGQGVRLTAASEAITPILRLYDPSDVLITEVTGTGSPSTAVINYISTVAGEFKAEIESETEGDATLTLECDPCVLNTPLSLNQEVTYSTVCGTTPGPFTFVSENTVNAIATFDLYDHFPMEERWDGNCPLGWNGTRDWREHSAGELNIGPFDMDVVLIAGTNIFTDDRLTINDVEVAIIGQTICKGAALFNLPQGDVAHVKCWEGGGAWCFAAGFIAVTTPDCVPDVDCSDAPPPGWCDHGAGTSQENLVPLMTSNTAPSGIASADVNSETAFQAFDRTDSTNWVDNFTIGPHWIMYQFPDPVTLYGYYIRLLPDSAMNLAITVEGSNDGVSWTNVHYRTNDGGASMVESQTFTTPGTFSYWRFTITKSEIFPAFLTTLELIGTRVFCCNGALEVEWSCHHCGSGAQAPNTHTCDEWVAEFAGGCIADTVWEQCRECLDGDWVVVPSHCPFDLEAEPPFCICTNQVYLVPA